MHKSRAVMSHNFKEVAWQLNISFHQLIKKNGRPFYGRQYFFK